VPQANPGRTPNTSSGTAPHAGPRCTPRRRSGSPLATAADSPRSTDGSSSASRSASPDSAETPRAAFPADSPCSTSFPPPRRRRRPISSAIHALFPRNLSFIRRLMAVRLWRSAVPSPRQHRLGDAGAVFSWRHSSTPGWGESATGASDSGISRHHSDRSAQRGENDGERGRELLLRLVQVGGALVYRGVA
jgi:hypothetical protein